jgi:hypothetical protein
MLSLRIYPFNESQTVIYHHIFKYYNLVQYLLDNGLSIICYIHISQYWMVYHRESTSGFNNEWM